LFAVDKDRIHALRFTIGSEDGLVLQGSFNMIKNLRNCITQQITTDLATAGAVAPAPCGIAALLATAAVAPANGARAARRWQGVCGSGCCEVLVVAHDPPHLLAV
jgi:hypothetical protein